MTFWLSERVTLMLKHAYTFLFGEDKHENGLIKQEFFNLV